MIVVADTSALYAAFDATQPEHLRAAAVVDRETLAVSPLAIAELDHLVHRDIGFPAALQVIETLTERMTAGQYKLAALSTADLTRAHKVRCKYDGLRLDLADAIGVVLADKYHTDRILTLDHRDFRVVAPLTPQFKAFRILPADS